MITDEKFREILRKLIAKSRANEVLWIATPQVGNAACVHFHPHMEIQVIMMLPDGAPDWGIVELRIDDCLAGKLTGEDDDPTYEIIKELHSDAVRCLHGFDERLIELSKLLDSMGKIGFDPTEATGGK